MPLILCHVNRKLKYYILLVELQNFNGKEQPPAGEKKISVGKITEVWKFFRWVTSVTILSNRTYLFLFYSYYHGIQEPLPLALLGD